MQRPVASRTLSVAVLAALIVLASGCTLTPAAKPNAMFLDVGSTSAPPAEGEGGATEPAEDEWTVSLMPYMYLADHFWGDATVHGITARVSWDTSDILDMLDIAAAGRVEVWKGNLGFIFDGSWLKLSDGGAQGPLAVDLDIRQGIADLAVAYQILDMQLGEARDTCLGRIAPRLRLQPYGGVRYQYLKQELTVTLTPPGILPPPLRRPGGTKVFGGDYDWLEPLVGLRAVVPISERVSLQVRGDASGFGVGSGSDLTWNFLVGVGYRVSNWMDVEVAARWLDIDYERGSGSDTFGLDTQMRGIQAGMRINF